VCGCLELYQIMLPQNTELTEIKFAHFDTLQQISFMKLQHPLFNHMTQPHMPQNSTIGLNLHRGDSTYNCTSQQFIDIF
jgi:hypothetical protein